LASPRGNADVLILAEKNNAQYSATSGISGEPFLINDPGEYDVKGVTVTGMPLKQGERYIAVYLIETEDIKILNLTHIHDFNMKEEDIEALGEIVIPSHYQIPGLSTAAGKLETFVKEMGGKSETMEKLLIKKKELPQEQIKLIILEPLR
jgi:hypothetical protein